MMDREPTYIKINNTIVDVSQMTAIQSMDIRVKILPAEEMEYRIQMYIGKEVAFSFLFADKETKDDVMRGIENTINELYLITQTGAYKAEDENTDEI